jgi:methyltransferase-like protein/2-polyprenyl-3-methyl-5-hydroxy-6-metoxy-1,4-benzoquinol methylase
MESVTTESYDEILYPSYTHCQTHPDRLEVISRLFGMNPAHAERCRVLELGCGNGSNLVPMAFALPKSEFIGIDLAARPLEKGQEMVRGLGLENISLHQLDLLALPADLGNFDYIIAHGLYAWVPAAVKDKILAICKSHLRPQGVAYISYNCYPGSHLRDMIRQMMLFHLRSITEPQQRINQAVALLRFVADSQTKSDTYTDFLREELKLTLELDQAQLYHDQLSDINAPVYFHQFVEHAARHGLQFLGEADFFEMQYHIYPPETVELLRRMAAESVILKEQYLDFLKCRRFRQTLLCHDGFKIDHRPKSQLLARLYLACPAQPISSDPDLTAKCVEEFVGPRGAKLATDYAPAKAALAHLGRIYPQAIHFSTLLAESRALSGPQEGGEKDQEQVLADILLHAYATGMLQLYRRAPDYVVHASERPAASPLARWQIERDTTVTNMRHVDVEVEDELGRQLLRLLDGSRNRERLLDDLCAIVTSGRDLLREHDAPVRDPKRARELLAPRLEENLDKLAKLALLVA